MSRKRLLILVLGLLGLGFVGVGVFASSAITLNSGQSVSLGAGHASVNVCGSQATISTQQYFNTSAQAYYTGTIDINGINAGNQCAGKTLSIAFLQNGSLVSATWPITTGFTDYYYALATASANTSTSMYTTTALSPFDTYASNLSTIAVAVQ